MTMQPPQDTRELVFTLGALRAAYAAGLPARAAMAEVYARIAAAGDPGIFIHLMAEEAALDAAEALGPFDPALPLWGMPFAVKDNIDVAGMPTTAACPAFAHMPACDAFVVARLRQAGAIPIGKTNLDQFATGLVGLRSPYPPPLNALDPAIVPGGSSSGSAVAVAHGIVPFALGTDTAGSGRVPAALNNIVGLKPTLGALSASGVVPACRTLDTVSIFALSVADAHAVLRVAAAYDPADAYARPLRTGPLGAALPAPRIAVPDAHSLRFFGDAVQARAFAAALADLAADGARIEAVDFTPFHEVARMLYDGAWVAERHAAIEDLMSRTPDAIHPVTRTIVSAAEGMSAADAFRGIYRLQELRRACAPVLEGADMLCVPTIPRFYTVGDLVRDPIGPNAELGTYTNFVNLLDLCALALPTGPRADGRPGGITLIGPAGADGIIAATAARIEARVRVSPGATGWPHEALRSAPAADEIALAADEIALAVCGAHMSGLPLNRELTSRGGRLLRAARSAPAYRLYHLAGGPPARPGMVRRPGREGVAIPLEVWALPLAAFGDFIAGVPAPLAIGTVTLEDGQTVKGFVCEDAGTEGAQDISACGGWRAYLAQQGAPVQG